MKNNFNVRQKKTRKWIIHVKHKRKKPLQRQRGQFDPKFQVEGVAPYDTGLQDNC